MDVPHLISDIPRLKPVAGHFRPAPFYLTEDMFGGLPLEMAGAELSGLVGAPLAEPHVHEHPEIYLLLSPEPGGAAIDVEVEGVRYEVVAPGAFYTPAGMRHRFVTRRAVKGSFCLGLLLLGERAAG